MAEVHIDGHSLTIEQVHEVARNRAKIQLSEKGKAQVNRCRAVIEEMVNSGEAIYGVTTGIGEFARIRVSPEQGAELQKRIIYSHAAGTGDPFPEDAVRGAILLRANVITKGYSGVRLSVLDTFIEMANRSVIPVVCEKGSLGVSGDLSPMSQLAEVILGEGEAFYRGERMSGTQAMRLAGLEPITLSYKEGLGLINGSQMMTAGLALCIYDSERLIKNAIIASAMTIDALKSVPKAFDARLHAVRPFNGQNAVAALIRKLTEGSEVIADKSGKVQDGYSLRCTPQVIGPTIDALFYTRQQAETEMNSAADNPLFFPEDNVHLAGGNFHGQACALVADFLGIAMSEVADLSERHTNRLLNPVLSGLPDFLVEGRGLNSGLMVAQYTAAALVSENKVLSHPASVDSISVSADQEDHVSMGPIAVRKLGEIIRNVRAVIAIEMMSAAQAFDFRAPKKPGKGTQIAYDEIRKVVSHLEDDRVLYPDIEKIRKLLENNTILQRVEAELGPMSLAWQK